jgi:hypothetical protein
MLNALRERIAAYLDERRVCILSTTGPEGARAMPVSYRSQGLEVTCLLPRWSDVAYDVQQAPRVMLIILDADTSVEQGRATPGMRWLQYAGTARLVERPDWSVWARDVRPTAPPDELYLIVRVIPRRIDLIDEGRGWGVRETLDL